MFFKKGGYIYNSKKNNGSFSKSKSKSKSFKKNKKTNKRKTSKRIKTQNFVTYNGLPF